MFTEHDETGFNPKFPNECPYCKSSPNGYESEEARDSHIRMFHSDQKPIKKQEKQKR